MNGKSLLRTLLILTSFFAISTASFPALAEGPESVGLIHFDAPAKWKAIDQPGRAIRMYVPPDISKTDQAMIIIAQGDAGEEFRTQFDQLVKVTLASTNILQRGQVRSGTSRQGFPVLNQSLTAAGKDGQTMMARFVAANVNGRTAFLCYIATLPDAYENYHPAMDKLLASVSFGDVAAANGNTQDPPKPSEAANQGAADSSFPPPEQWGRQADQRRKPHTILGDVFNTRGQPIKGLKGDVHVGGTTLRGDRSAYQLEIDEHGHFEMEVPDGVYRLTPMLSIDYDGQSMPVQLVPLDGKSPGQSFNSRDGIVRDYRWVLLGHRPGTPTDSFVDYFGAHLSFEDPYFGNAGRTLKGRWPAGTKLRIVFTPTGPLVDGSEGRQIPMEMDVSVLLTLARQGYLSVPIGTYKADGELIAPDGRRQPVWMSLQTGGGNRSQELEIHFAPSNIGDEIKGVTLWVSDAER